MTGLLLAGIGVCYVRTSPRHCPQRGLSAPFIMCIQEHFPFALSSTSTSAADSFQTNALLPNALAVPQGGEEGNKKGSWRRKRVTGGRKPPPPLAYISPVLEGIPEAYTRERGCSTSRRRHTHRRTSSSSTPKRRMRPSNGRLTILRATGKILGLC